MNRSRLLALAVFAAPLLSPALAGTDIPVVPFSGINAHGGAHVTLHHGATQRVTVLKGDMKVARITIVNGNTLDIDPCPDNFSCVMHRNDLDVDIVSPHVENIEVHGGALLRAEGTFPKQETLNLEAHGGARLDAKAITAEKVNAEAHGGGSIHTAVISTLAAEAHGGGVIRYAGNPTHLASKMHGGGVVTQE